MFWFCSVEIFWSSIIFPLLIIIILLHILSTSCIMWVDNNTVLINPIYGELFLPSHLPFAYDNSPRSDFEVACDVGLEFPIYATPQECLEVGGQIIDDVFNYSDFTNSNVYWGNNS